MNVKHADTRFAMCLAGLLTVASCALANVTNSVPWADNFEAYTAGETIIGSNGWEALTAEAASSVATTYTFTATSLPLGGDHTKVMNLTAEGIVSNNFDTSSTIGLTNVLIDAMISPIPSEEFPALSNDVQAAIMVDTSGYLVVYHSYDVNHDGTLFSNKFTTLYNTPLITGEWHRLTVTMDYLSDTDSGNSGGLELKFFKAQLDGGTAFTNAEAALNPTNITEGYDGSWFLCANTDAGNKDAVNPYLTGVSFSGSGLVDDFAVTNTADFGVILTASISPTHGLGGTISPVGIVQLVSGANTNFQIDASNYWKIAYIKTNAVSISGGTPLDITSTNYLWENLTQSATIEAVFQADLTTSQSVPKWWLHSANPSWGEPEFEAAATDNSDGDVNRDGSPFQAWQERLASTDPIVSNEFEIVEVGIINGSNYIKWVSAKVDPDLPPLGVRRTTNLLESPLLPVGTHARMNGTNIWLDATLSTANSNVFYDVVGTNSP